jgi:alpha-galactosidase
MQLEPVALAVEVDGEGRREVPLPGPGTAELGPLAVRLDEGWRWSVANRGDRSVRVRSVRACFAIDRVRGPLRAFLHGYQSWSRSGVATLGIDRDPSDRGRVAGLVRAMHHADGRVAPEGHLRSELVTVLADDGPDRLLLGFDGGASHDGTFWLRPGDGRPVVEVEAFLGGAELPAGAQRELHGFGVVEGDDHADLLERWARDRGRAEGARTGSPYQVGWCSWYHYFHGVTEDDLRSNLALAGAWPFEVFQLDDGYQRTIGDWLVTNERFPSDLDVLAGAIAAAGRRPGIWLAPFVARPDATVAVEHPDWVARYVDGERELIGMWHPDWGGATHALDTTNPAVLAWLEDVARSLVDAGFTYLKLDFTYAPAADGVFADPTRTPAERVRAGYDAIRRGAGDDAFLLGCGAPLGSTIGTVDGMRIGADVAPHWALEDHQYRPGAYEDGEPATRNAWGCTLTRSFQHRALWLNDPDCVMLRREATSLDEEAIRTWAHAVGVSGGMALVSDDLALLDDRARGLLDEVVALGRASDEAAARGAPARCPDLLDAPMPGRLRAAGVELVADPDVPTSHLDRGTSEV